MQFHQFYFFVMVTCLTLSICAHATIRNKYNDTDGLLKDSTEKFIQAILKEFSNGTIIFLSNKKDYFTEFARSSADLNIVTVLLDANTTLPNLEEIELESKENILCLHICSNCFSTGSISSEVNFLQVINEESDWEKMKNIKQEEYYKRFFAIETHSGFDLYGNCLYCNEGNTTLEEINSWSDHTGFSKPFKLPPVFKGSFFGKTMKFVFKPYITGIYPKTDDFGKEKYIGLEYDMILDISELLNYSVQMVQPADGEWGRYDQVNKRWTGVVGSVYYGEADVGLGDITFSYSRYGAVNPTAVVNMKEIGILSAKPHKDPRWQSIFEAFTPLLWLLTALAVMATAIALYIIHYFSQSEEPISFASAVFICVVPLFMEPFDVKKPSYYSIFLLSIWLLMSTLVLSFYTGALTSLIMAPPFSQKPIDTTEDLLQSGRLWMTDTGSHFDSVFDVIKPQLKKQFYPLQKKLSIFGGYEMILQSPEKYTRIMDKAKLTSEALEFYLEPEGINPLYMSKQTLNFDIGSWQVRKICPWRKDLTLQLVRIRDVGLQEYYKRKAFFNLKSKMLAFGKEYGNGRVTQLQLSHFIKMVITPSLGYILGLFVFIIELIISKIHGGDQSLKNCSTSSSERLEEGS